jgi:hypothetical protein
MAEMQSCLVTMMKFYYAWQDLLLHSVWSDLRIRYILRYACYKLNT